MVKKIGVLTASLIFGLGMQLTFAQKILQANNGHSHNDYKQEIPLLTAYYAEMGSIEADVFCRNGALYVAHDSTEISGAATLKKLYLDPLAAFYRHNGNHPYGNAKAKLQLVIDIKQDYEQVLPQLLKEIASYREVFDQQKNPNAIRMVISGNVPEPDHFADYPKLISFDGRPYINYTEKQLSRVAMISDELKSYTEWNGKGNPTQADEVKLKAVIAKAHQQGKPFRFWATQDSPNTWIVLERLGVDWINTDHPSDLKRFYQDQEKLSYTNPAAYPVYTPSYKSDGQKKRAKNVILLIGDGMGLAQIHAGLMANHGQLNLTRLKNMGLAQTSAADAGNTDSAAGATALATGSKTNNRYIGVGPNGEKKTNLVDTLAGLQIKSAIISVGDITDATPAAFYAHQLDRSMSTEIAADLLSSKVEILVGSNLRSFLQNPDKDLLKKLGNQGFQVHTSFSDFKQQKNGKQLVLLPDSATRPIYKGRGTILAQSLSKSIDLLKNNNAGFFIMAEGAQIDYGGHSNNLPYVVTEMHDFDKTIGAALKFADQDGETLVIVTADHETGGLTLLDTDIEKGMIRGAFSTNDHTNIMVPVFAYGPGAEDFKGVFQNNEIFFKILKAFGIK
ncbi:alkaline phosphatase [Pedobacter rhizosphaerae]|uniref:Alkaline phosphatase n=1 Tax=Pedobacter rhizosphaerae TaxID=390241 RepID=A0A1H9MPA5_9SPHI|nr:alkaline phosphatase [Pedobacter rhizosphaerae]SER25526.1 alkaline phosphatase [Pedobacter rhizosphaerae]